MSEHDVMVTVTNFGARRRGRHAMSAGYVVPAEWVQVMREHLNTWPDEKELRAALAAVLPLAIAAERERCARVAENESDYCLCGGPPCQIPPGHGCGVQQANGERIAAAIRGDAT